MLECLFQLKGNGTDVKTEILAGVTTFLTMAYIIFVNPSMLASAGMDHGAVFVATCVAAAIGCLIMGLYANLPLALAPGMGLNAFFSYTVVGQMGYSWEVALGAVFLSGVCFFILSAFKIRELIINSIPQALRGGITAGIGLFLGFVALQNSGIVIKNDATMLTMGDMGSWSALMTALGFIIIVSLFYRQVTGSVMIGILVVTGISILAGKIAVVSPMAMPPSVLPTFMQMNIQGAVEVGMVSIIFSFLFVDLFDTSGTLIAVTQKGNLINEDGTIPRLGKALMADSVATMAGTVLGTSTTTSYVESTAGITVGGRTGLTAVVVGILFLLSLFFSPLAGMVPTYATAPALIFVAVLMTQGLVDLDWSDSTESAPVVLTAIAMPLTYSVTIGIAFGFISYTIIKLLSGRHRDIHPVLYAVAILFAVKLAIFS